MSVEYTLSLIIEMTKLEKYKNLYLTAYAIVFVIFLYADNENELNQSSNGFSRGNKRVRKCIQSLIIYGKNNQTFHMCKNRGGGNGGQQGPGLPIVLKLACVPSPQRPPQIIPSISWLAPHKS